MPLPLLVVAWLLIALTGLLTARLVANRFLLFAIWSNTAVVTLVIRVMQSTYVAAAVAATGDEPPVPLWTSLGQMATAVVSLSSIWLTFAAPQVYRRWVAGVSQG